MRIQKACCLALAGLALSACGDFQEQGGEPEQDPIIRATSNGGRNEVVMLFSVVVLNGQIFHRTCTGSYYAPRVVLTAAHCLEDTWLNGIPNQRPQMFVYWGDNFEQDRSQLTGSGSFFTPPAIGSPSNFAQADSITIHPNWDPELIHPDMGIVFLDRKPPFDPLPLHRPRVGSNVNVTISGWGSNTAPTPTTGAGAQVQRTGTTRTLGSPTAADFHPDDPNPGMLNATVRQNVIKMDGRAPNSNGCFGDSGGPFIIKQFGQDYFAGVSYFTGLSCEDYSLYVRLDPFLPFLDLSYKRGGQDVLRPTFQCVSPNPQGTLTAHFGYRNDNGVVVHIPYGTKNASARDTLGFRPKQFFPGNHIFSASIDFPSGQSAAWTLSPDNNPTTTLTANTSSPRCTAAQKPETDGALFCRSTFRSSCTPTNTFSQCSEGAGAERRFYESTPELADCLPLQRAWFDCVIAAAPGAANWNCTDFSFPIPNACVDAAFAYFYCY